MTILHHLHILPIFRSGFQEDLFHHLPADQPSWILLLALLEDKGNICVWPNPVDSLFTSHLTLQDDSLLEGHLAFISTPTHTSRELQESLAERTQTNNTQNTCSLNYKQNQSLELKLEVSWL